jgi:uridine kinase
MVQTLWRPDGLLHLRIAVLFSCAMVAVNAFGAAPASSLLGMPQGPAWCSLRGGGRNGRTDSPTLRKLKANALEDPVMPPPGSGANVLVIGVAGGSGGGKSVFCTKLENMMQKICPTVVISHDNYYKNKADVDRECDGNWDCPTALHTDELVRDLITLQSGGLARIPIYSFADNARVKDRSTERQFPPGARGVLVVEGLMVLHDEALRSRMDIRIYVDCDEDTRFMRRLARDTHPLKGRGRTVADVYGAWARNVKPNHHKFVEPTKRYAHMIIPHHGLWADPGHLLAVSEDPSSLLDAYVTRVSLGDQALKQDEWSADKQGDAKVAAALEQVRKRGGDRGSGLGAEEEREPHEIRTPDPELQTTKRETRNACRHLKGRRRKKARVPCSRCFPVRVPLFACLPACLSLPLSLFHLPM